MSNSRYDIQNLKVTQWAALIVQAALAVLFLLPAGTTLDGSAPVNSIQMGLLYLRYGDLMHFIGGLLYCAPLFVIPVAVWLVTLLRKPRANYGICMALCAWETISSSIFYTTAAHRMSAVLVANFLCYVVVFVEIIDLALFTRAFLTAWQPPKRK
ncbi:MAG: hypothetical protein LKE53_11055 [Oscillospiraceae bacterium]|jgi:hypothetical protein|nr:hypothetical protein [Oscillospiraceae bacterium]MDD3260614.1 hypothetical protein [Oscillospiraceae bacterium]